MNLFSSAMTLSFAQGHNCVSSQTGHIFNLHHNGNISDNIYAMAFKFGMAVDVCTARMLMFISMTSTMMQGHSGSVAGGWGAGGLGRGGAGEGRINQR